MTRTAVATPIHYQQDGEWTGYSLDRREDGLWVYQQWSAIQGSRSGRVVVLEAPAGLQIEDEADMDTLLSQSGYCTKADAVREGREIRCIRRGYLVE